MNCEVCGSENADWIEDPYQADIHGRTTMRWLCTECYRELMMDI